MYFDKIRMKLTHWVSLKIFNEIQAAFRILMSGLCIATFFLSFPQLLFLGDINAITSLLTPRVPLDSHYCTISGKNADLTSILLYWINEIQKKGKLLKCGNEKKISVFR